MKSIFAVAAFVFAAFVPSLHAGLDQCPGEALNVSIRIDGETDGRIAAFLARDGRCRELRAANDRLTAELMKLAETLSSTDPELRNLLRGEAANPKNSGTGLARYSAPALAVLRRNPDFLRLELQNGIASCRLMIRETELLYDGSPEATELLIARQKLQMVHFGPAEKWPKAEIAGSPEFRAAMYMVDQYKNGDRIQLKWSLINAGILLTEKLEPIALRDPEFRAAAREKELTLLRSLLRRAEIQQENFTLALRTRQGKSVGDLEKLIWLDADYLRLSERDREISRSFPALLTKFAASSDAPEAREFRMFQQAVDQL